MMRRTGWAVLSLMLAVGFGCATQPLGPDVIDVTLQAPADRVKAAVTKVLVEDDYCCVDWKDGTQLQAGYREEQPSIWEWMVKGRLGVVRSRAEASVTPETDQSSRLRIQVSSEGKRTMFDSWEPVTPQVPQSAENKLRLIKNELKLVTTPYTTQSFIKGQYKMQ
ncbi:MAG: hypothetical protein FJ247_05210 [Nitrospira sp.]|nr:hypothetical protein [Nitrospira sp.]